MMQAGQQRPKRTAAQLAQQRLAEENDSDSENSSQTSHTGSEYTQSDDGDSGCESDSSDTQAAGLRRLHDEALLKKETLCKRLDVTQTEMKPFVSGALVLANEDTLARFASNLHDVYNFYAPLELLLRKLGIHAGDIGNLALHALIEPLRTMDVSGRIEFARTVLMPLLPSGGALANLVMHPGAVLCIIVVAHAVTAARIEHVKQQEGVRDVFSVLFGGESQYSDDATAGLTMDSVLESLHARVQLWVKQSAALDDANFFRRLILNVAELGKDLGRVRTVLGYARKLPINVAFMDNSYMRGDIKLVHKSGNGLLRLQLADVPTGKLATDLGLNPTETRLRIMGLAALGDETGVVAMAQKPFPLNDPGAALRAFEEATKAPMMSKALSKMVAAETTIYPGGAPCIDGAYIHVRDSTRSADATIAKYNTENLWRLLGVHASRAKMITVTMVPITAVPERSWGIRALMLPKLTEAELALLTAKRAYTSTLLVHKIQNAPEVKAARKAMKLATKALDSEQKTAPKARKLV